MQFKRCNWPITMRAMLKSKSDPRTAQPVFVMILAIAVFFLQSFSAVAYSGGTWIEICAGDGVKLVEMDGDSEQDGDDCVRCELCLVTSGSKLAVDAPVKTPARAEIFTPFIFAESQTAGLVLPAQYWPAVRGPPVMSRNKQMTLTTSTTALPAGVTASTTWSNPCL